MNNRCGNDSDSFDVNVGADTAKFTNMIMTSLDRAEIWSEKVR